MTGDARVPRRWSPAVRSQALLWPPDSCADESCLAGATAVSSTGCWVVSTESGTVHLLDLDRGVVTRFRPSRSLVKGSPAELRRDGEDIPLISVVAVLGYPMCLMLAVRDDGVMTLRQTTPVVAIDSARAPMEAPDAVGGA